MASYNAQSPIKLSICIPTYNRAAILASTLETIISQVTEQCEVVISDNASIDETEQVVAQFAQRFERLRYVKQSTNGGIDRNIDNVVDIATGEYCWLVPDDDAIEKDALATILEVLRQDYSLVVVNARIVDAHTSAVLWPRRPNILMDRIYGPDELDGLYELAGEQLTYLGAVVINRAIWLERERKRYYGTLGAYHVVIFQKPLPGNALVMARPLIVHKLGNQTWLENTMEMYSKMGLLIEALAISEAQKENLRRKTSKVGNKAKALLISRAMGLYTLKDYRFWIRPHLRSAWSELVAILIAILPSILVYYCVMSIYSLVPGDQSSTLTQIRNNRYAILRNRRYSRKR